MNSAPRRNRSFYRLLQHKKEAFRHLENLTRKKNNCFTWNIILIFFQKIIKSDATAINFVKSRIKAVGIPRIGNIEVIA